MKYLIILSHLMSKDCELGDESIARCELAIKMFKKNGYNMIITVGWAYRVDCSTPISDVVKKFIVQTSKIDERLIKSLPLSRDTVGDAYYCLDFLKDKPISELHVVTSDYHTERTELIFRKIFGNRVNIDVFGVNTGSRLNNEVLIHERESMEAFMKTFKNVSFSSHAAVKTALSTKHPYYNGTVHPKIY